MAVAVNQRLARRRDALRQAGLRPVQLWVPDTRRPGFLAECRRQSALLSDDAEEGCVQDWLALVADDWGWE